MPFYSGPFIYTKRKHVREKITEGMEKNGEVENMAAMYSKPEQNRYCRLIPEYVELRAASIQMQCYVTHVRKCTSLSLRFFFWQVSGHRRVEGERTKAVNLSSYQLFGQDLRSNKLHIGFSISASLSGDVMEKVGK